MSCSPQPLSLYHMSFKFSQSNCSLLSQNLFLGWTPRQCYIHYIQINLPYVGNDKGCSWNEKVVHSVKLLSHWLSMDCVMRNTPTGLCYHLHKATSLKTIELLFRNQISIQMNEYSIASIFSGIVFSKLARKGMQIAVNKADQRYRFQRNITYLTT